MIPIPTAEWLAFALVALGIALTPGANTAYVVSRSISQGRSAGLISLGGLAMGLVVYLVLAALGITGVLLAVPGAYDVLRIGGALYLAWLAWQALRSGRGTSFQTQELPKESPQRLFALGLLTCLLNPAVAVLYLALLPQFIHPERGRIMAQTILLGSSHIVIAVCVNGLYGLVAHGLVHVIRGKPAWLTAQRFVMATVFAFLAIRMIVRSPY